MRGVNYELAIALAPPDTQLLLLTGSVANPHDVVAWLRRIGRDAVLVSHEERPVPLEEVDLERLPDRAASQVHGWWPRHDRQCAARGPRARSSSSRRAAMRPRISRGSSPRRFQPRIPLRLSPEQEQLAGPRLAKLLQQRVAYHHSGLSYAQRAGLVEPLAKAGQLRVVVATMGLAAGINFSMRSVAITGTSLSAPGISSTRCSPMSSCRCSAAPGAAGSMKSVTRSSPRSRRACTMPARASSAARRMVDWPTLIAVMQGAIAAGAGAFCRRAGAE